MALDPVFAAAYIDNDARHRLFGRTLRPFCLWHLALLQTIDSPFISDGSEKESAATLRDLKTAIGICSLAYRHSKVKRPVFPIKLGREDLDESVAEFMAYIYDYYRKPEYAIKDPNPYAPPPAPLSHAPAAVTTAYHAAWGAGVPVSVAWNMPIGEAYISEAFFFKNKGEAIDFMSEEDRQMQREMRAAGLS